MDKDEGGWGSPPPGRRLMSRTALRRLQNDPLYPSAAICVICGQFSEPRMGSDLECSLRYWMHRVIGISEPLGLSAGRAVRGIGRRPLRAREGCTTTSRLRRTAAGFLPGHVVARLLLFDLQPGADVVPGAHRSSARCARHVPGALVSPATPSTPVRPAARCARRNCWLNGSQGGSGGAGVGWGVRESAALSAPTYVEPELPEAGSPGKARGTMPRCPRRSRAGPAAHPSRR
jgi:hypothetical protein